MSRNKSLTVMNFDFEKRAEIAQYVSLKLTRSYYGIGSWELTAHPGVSGIGELAPGVMAFPSGEPGKALLCEEITVTRDKYVAKGVQLKGLAKRRVCVPPLTLPSELWRYAGGAWTQVTDAGAIRAALAGDVYQGFERPENPSDGQWFLDLTGLGTVYDWGASMEQGQLVSDLGTAQLRSKYQNFGWDRFTGSAEAAYHHYAHNNLISPEDASRAMPGMIAGTSLDRGLTLPWQARFDKLESVFASIGEATGVGWDIRPDLDAEKLVFEAVAGADRTSGQQVVLISERMGNASLVTRAHSLSGSARTVYVGGAGEDENRFILAVGEGTGLARRELWAEAGSASDTDMLRLYGQNKLDAARERHTLTAALLDSGACRYGRDYDVGDRVLVRGAGGEMAARITEITETHENGKRTLSATFGDAPVTVAQAVGRGAGAAR